MLLKSARGDRLLDDSSSTKPGIADKLAIEVATNSEFQKISNFIAEYMYPRDMPAGQRREIARLELTDLNERYAERVRPRKFPSVLLKGTIKNQLIGVVGVDCQILDRKNKQLQDITLGSEANQKEIVPVLANLAVSTQFRRSGYGSQLIKSCEVFAKEWGFNSLYLLVNADNIIAQNLYRRIGFETVYTDTSSSVVQSTPNGLRTVPMTKICLRKMLNAPLPRNNF